MNRRLFTQLAFLTTGLASFWADANAKQKVEPRQAQAMEQALQAHKAFMAIDGVQMMGEEHIAMLLYPGFTALDLVGPQYIFASLMGANVHLVSPTPDLAPVQCDTGFMIVPTITQQDLPEKLDLLFLPGSASGVLQAMKNDTFIDFIRTKAQHSRFVTSVCTGSLLLGKAGLLKGKKASSHWVTLDLLAKLGAMPVQQRVVWDGNIITGGGVTAGMDYGLEVAAALRGRKYAEALQLQAEYDPHPPFDVGSPDKADPVVKNMVESMFAPLHVKLELEL